MGPREYYAAVMDAFYGFLRGRMVACRHGEGFFRRWADRKRGIPLYMDDEATVLRLVDRGFIDFYLSVNPHPNQPPDIFVLDIDAGDEIRGREEGFSLVKHVTRAVVSVLVDMGIQPAVKFSGMRGFHVLFGLTSSDEGTFSEARSFVEAIEPLVEKRIREDEEARRLSRVLVPEWKTVVTTQVHYREFRRNQVLLDPSPMRRNGLFRSVFSLHYRSLLASVPVEGDVLDFDASHALPERVAADCRRLASSFRLNYYPASKLLENPLGLV